MSNDGQNNNRMAATLRSRVAYGVIAENLHAQAVPNNPTKLILPLIIEGGDKIEGPRPCFFVGEGCPPPPRCRSPFPAP